MGTVTSAAGVVSEGAASLLFLQNRAASKRMTLSQQDLVETRNLTRALQVIETADIQPSELEVLISEIVERLIRIRGQ